MLVGAEAERPASAAVKDYVRGEAGREKVYVDDEGFYAEHDIELRLERRAVELDLSGSEVTLDNNERVSYHRLLSRPARSRGGSRPAQSSTV